MNKRRLTGNWYIQKTLFGFKIMVEVIIQNYFCNEFKRYEEATKSDIIELEIKIFNN